MKNSMAHARKTSIDTERFVAYQIRILERIKKSGLLFGSNEVEIEKTLKLLDEQNIDIEKIYVKNLRGKVIYNSSEVEPDYGDYDFFNLISELKRRRYLFRIYRTLSHRVVITVSSLIKKADGTPLGVIFLEINRMKLSSILSENVNGKTTKLYLLDERNEIITSFPENAAGNLLVYMRKIINRFQYGVYSISGGEMKTALVSVYLPIVGFGWKVLLIQEQGEVYSLVSTFRRELYKILLLTMIIAIIIALIISQNIAIPILTVTKGTSELAAGNLDTRIDVKSRDEIGELASNFNFMAESLRKKMKELEEAYDKLKKYTATIEEQNRKLDRKIFEITTLYEIGQQMSEVGTDIDRLLDIIIDKSMEAAGAERASLMLMNDDEKLEVQRVRVWDKNSGKSISIENFPKNITIGLGEGIAGKVVLTSQMYVANNIGNDENFKPYDNIAISTPERLVCIPLKIKKHTFGVINIANKRDGSEFNEKDTGLLQTLANQAALALDNAKLFKLAITDGLTDLFMVRYFKNRLEEEIKRARRYGAVFSLIFMDIDHFKSFNDTYGHQQGDVVIRECAAMIKKTIRTDIDIPARYGGEELIVLLPETDDEGAYVVAERLRVAIEEYEFPGQEEPLHVTISLGISCYPKHATTGLELIQKADTALYFSKENGRNQTTIYSENMGLVTEK
jgi:diguanylate cyclase (GGDEF)-like protein